MNIRTHLRRAKLRALLAVKRLLERVARGTVQQPSQVPSPACAPPEMTFELEPGVAYTPERQRQVADCMRRANDDFMAYGIGRLQQDGTIDRDWPVHISVSVRHERVSWALVSHSGHRFAATLPMYVNPNS